MQRRGFVSTNGRNPPDRSCSMDDALQLLNERQQATTKLNHLLQTALADHKIAGSYQAFRARYLQALGQLAPAPYAATNCPDLVADDTAIQTYLQSIRTAEATKKEQYDALQSAWFAYDAVATDKPEVLSADDLTTEQALDTSEDELTTAWLDFCGLVLAQAKQDDKAGLGEAADIAAWRACKKDLKKNDKQIQRVL